MQLTLRLPDLGPVKLLLLILVTVALNATPAQAQSRADVKAIQTMLNQLGFPVGRPDGAAGRKTRGAIRNYQKQSGLLVDGRASRELRAHIQQKINSRRVATPAKTKTRTSPQRNTVTTQKATTRAPRPSSAQRRSKGTAVAVRAGTLRKLPNRRLAGISPFALGARFDILTRRGLWLELASADRRVSGWARLGSVKLAAPTRSGRGASVQTNTPANQASSSGGGLAGFSRALTGWLGGSSSNATSSTATLGIRGLTRNQLNANGQADNAAMARLDRLANPRSAENFARVGGLQARNVPYPVARSAPAAASTSQPFDSDTDDTSGDN